MSNSEATASTPGNEIVVTRLLDAPRDLAFRAWTDPDCISLWWGPDGFRTTTEHMDVRPGGSWVFTMHGPDGTDYLNRIIYDEVVRPERITYRQSGDGETRDIKFRSTVTFDDEAGKTRITLRMVFETPRERDHVIENFGAVEGGKQTVTRLNDYLARQRREMQVFTPTEKQIRLERLLDAPRELVFEVWTKPEHIRKWWGCAVSELVVCEIDFRPGGKWRYVMRDDKGTEYPFKGEFFEIDPPGRIVSTQVYDVPPIDQNVAHIVTTFEEIAGKTLIVELMTMDTREARDGMLNSGMTDGAATAYRRLEELVLELKAERAK